MTTPTHSAAIDPATIPPRGEPRISRRLKFYFAILSCLGGVLIGSSDETAGFTAVAVFFAIFGFVCVDWLKLFSLLPILAYVVMGLAGLYCVSDFTDMTAPGMDRIKAVAELLVVVQAVLMLQPKTPRILEQITVFCLLQLIVAGVFNDAMSFGMTLVPIGVIGAWSLSLLASLGAVTRGDENTLVENVMAPGGEAGWATTSPAAQPSPPASLVSTWSGESQQSIDHAARRVSRVASLTIAPAVLMIGCLFFYALPRTTDAAAGGRGGKTLVGFSDSVDLRQIGQMLQSSEQALRISMTDRRTGRLYPLVGQMYLRGKVMERYAVISQGPFRSTHWSSASAGLLSKPGGLPVEYFPTRGGQANFYDSVKVAIDCESMNTSALFSLPPYHNIGGSAGILHEPGHWTLRRGNLGDGASQYSKPRISYAMGTHAFRGGIQNELVARWAVDDPWRRSRRVRDDESLDESPDESSDASSAESPDRSGPEDQTTRLMLMELEDLDRAYLDECLTFDPRTIPTAERLASTILDLLPSRRRNPYDFAKAMAGHLSEAGGFTYTLNLNSDEVPGMDPVEQFLTIDRKGNCQFFASALVMMLRSQQIPARLVVGYATDEFNELGKYYVARQLHAHVWVEALIRREDLPEAANVYGQPPSDAYWLRLDPTPGGGGGDDVRPDPGVGQVLDLAQNMWKDYVVDMDGKRQEQALLAGTGATPMSEAYGGMIRRIQMTLVRMRNGQLDAAGASRPQFSLTAAAAAVAAAALVMLLLRIQLPRWLRRSRAAGRETVAATPSLSFYADAVEELGRIGIRRAAAQTPAELLTETSLRDPSPAEPLGVLTKMFYRVRFGRDDLNASLAGETLQVLRNRIESMVLSGRTKRE